MVLGKLPVPGRPIIWACCACSRCGWRVVWTFLLSSIRFSPLSPSLWETARYRLKYCLKGPLSPKQPTNQPIQGGTSVVVPQYYMLLRTCVYEL